MSRPRADIAGPIVARTRPPTNSFFGNPDSREPECVSLRREEAELSAGWIYRGRVIDTESHTRDSELTDPEQRLIQAWPSLRLRLGWTFVLFFLFEVTIGQRLPSVIPIALLAAGTALLASAGRSIRALRSVRE